MAWQDRDYNREDESGGSSPFQWTGMSVTLWLLVVNVVVYFLDEILYVSSRGNPLAPFTWGNFNIAQAVRGLQLWRWITYQFIHNPTNFFHILFNMMVLLYLGPYMERWWGRWRYLAFYLLCGVSGAFVYTGLHFIPGLLGVSEGVPLIGASGSIYGVLIGCAVVYPKQEIGILFLPFRFTLRTMAFILIALSIAAIAAGSHNAGGDAAHLGGVVVGFVLVHFPFLLGFVPNQSKSRVERAEGKFFRKKEQERRAEEAEQTEVDRILDKVRDHGLHSLTRNEKKVLQRATERQRRAG